MNKTINKIILGSFALLVFFGVSAMLNRQLSIRRPALTSGRYKAPWTSSGPASAG